MELIRNSQLMYEARKKSALIWVLLLIVEIFFVLLAVASPIIAVCTAFVLIAIFLLFTKPEYALYLFVFSIIPAPFVLVRFGVVTINASYPITMILMMSWMIARLAGTRSAGPTTECRQALMAFGIWAFLSLFWTRDLSVGYEDFTKLFLDIAAVFMVVAMIRDKKHFKYLLGIFIFTGFLTPLWRCIILIPLIIYGK